jgi:hypothetical protein
VDRRPHDVANDIAALIAQGMAVMKRTLEG